MDYEPVTNIEKMSTILQVNWLNKYFKTLTMIAFNNYLTGRCSWHYIPGWMLPFCALFTRLRFLSIAWILRHCCCPIPNWTKSRIGRFI